MADEIAQGLEDSVLPSNPPGVAECLVQTDLQIKPWGLGQVDNTERISQVLVREVLSKCRPLEINFPVTRGCSKTGHGQGGFIRREAIHSSPGGTRTTKYSVIPVTAKHNLRRVFAPDGGREHRPTEARFKLRGGYVQMESGDLDWVPTEVDLFDLRAGLEARPAWTLYGLDISVAELIDDPMHSATDSNQSFSKIRQGFTLEKGQKVGIAVMFDEDSKPTKKTIGGAFEQGLEVNISELDIERIYGQPGKVNIYTGEIIYVGEKHIEYSINSFTGCSGAIVFLLDKDQPPSVDPSDWGRAVAIHSGAHPTLGDRNYGLLINHHPSFDY